MTSDHDALVQYASDLIDALVGGTEPVTDDPRRRAHALQMAMGAAVLVNRSVLVSETPTVSPTQRDVLFEVGRHHHLMRRTALAQSELAGADVNGIDTAVAATLILDDAIHGGTGMVAEIPDDEAIGSLEVYVGSCLDEAFSLLKSSSATVDGRITVAAAILAHADWIGR